MDDEGGREVLYLFIPEEQRPGEPPGLNPFPNGRLDYAVVEVLPPKPGKMPTKTPQHARATPTNITTRVDEEPARDDRQGVKRTRDDYEALGDALRGEHEKMTLAKYLKVPKEIGENTNIFYPHIWLEKGAPAEAWKHALSEWMLLRGISFTEQQDEPQRLAFVRHRSEFIAWLETVTAHQDPQDFMEKDKKFWSLPFSITISLFSLAAYSKSGLEHEYHTRSALQKAFEQGYINFSLVNLQAPKAPTKNAGKQQQEVFHRRGVRRPKR